MVLPFTGGRVGRCQLAPPGYESSREAFLLAVFKGFVGVKPDLRKNAHFCARVIVGVRGVSPKIIIR